MHHAFFETKVLADDDGAISGLAWKFGVPDRMGDWIEPGSFKNAKMPIPLLFGHDMGDPVGAWESATEKSDGLHLKGKLLVNDVARAREVSALVKAGAVRGLSIGFIIKNASARSGGGRTIKNLELLECSLVTIPMHADAKVVSAKSAIQALQLASAINRAAAQFGRN
ncbi:HK97 family phage prohead protease [Pararhizobium sp. YC-54]|uniref:HK97 family phage prohead protease n=1 Tax=Pararhizobium sp. YC-54 TaxID=2986920 RepID=UPI0021F6D586|nr:HK97 family phage prohead protease [Pararhizobium sp. YC-54]MCV9997673.1 HK97 family phage prohead protease [Pararhizobium sp. YC-54]